MAIAKSINSKVSLIHVVLIISIISIVSSQTADDDEVMLGIPDYPHRFFSGILNIIKDIWILV
jgi:hypothetical protein